MGQTSILDHSLGSAHLHAGLEQVHWECYCFCEGGGEGATHERGEEWNVFFAHIIEGFNEI